MTNQTTTWNGTVWTLDGQIIPKTKAESYAISEMMAEDAAAIADRLAMTESELREHHRRRSAQDHLNPANYERH